MCLTCGCGEPNRAMGLANLTYDDIERVARENDVTVAETIERLEAASAVARRETAEPDLRRTGAAVEQAAAASS